MIPVKLMVFDLDGTLADTGADLAGSVNRPYPNAAGFPAASCR